jgi:type 1 glutamine amidotransferase
VVYNPALAVERRDTVRSVVDMVDERAWRDVVRVLLVTATAGYRHQSIPTARTVLQSVGRSSGDFVVATDLEDVSDLERLTAAVLADHDLLCFVHTSGELPLDDEQKQAILDFVAGGKGFVGVHSASTILYDWSGYREMLGAHFQMHPPGQPFTVVVENREHPSTRHLAPRFEVTDELYTFRTNPRDVAHILLQAEAGSAGLDGDLPLAWARTYGDGRVYYNALGHYDAGWEDPAFQAQILGGLRWASSR